VLEARINPARDESIVSTCAEWDSLLKAPVGALMSWLPGPPFPLLTSSPRRRVSISKPLLYPIRDPSLKRSSAKELMFTKRDGGGGRKNRGLDFSDLSKAPSAIAFWRTRIG
jgi:hypothetical protein